MTLLTLGAINVQADDPAALGHFWAAALGATVEVYDGFVYLTPADPSGFAMFFQGRSAPAPGPGAPHLDLTVPWGTREAEVARLTALGAEHKWDVLDEQPHVRWTTLADPEGNLFCVAEHPPRAALTPER